MSDVAAYHVFTRIGMLFPEQEGMWTQSTKLLALETTHKYMICCHIAENNEILIILTRDFGKEQYVLREDDMRYAIETRRSILSVLV